jgi:hypothetical protein
MHIPIIEMLTNFRENPILQKLCIRLFGQSVYSMNWPNSVETETTKNISKYYNSL